MDASRGNTLAELFGELLVGYVASAAATVARWARIGWSSFFGYLVVVFMLAATGHQSAAFLVFGFAPLLAILTIVFIVPGLALGALLWPAVRDTRVGQFLQKLAKGVVGGGWFAFSLGSDVNDIWRFQWSHPWLSALLCIFAVPAVTRQLKSEQDWGFWGSGALIVSAIVYGLDILEFLSTRTG